MITVHPDVHRAARITVHPSQRQHHVEPVSEPLHVVTCVTNPERFYARYKNYAVFAKHMAESGVRLYTVELALRDRHHELAQTTEAEVVRLRSESILWHKENLLNVGIARFDPSWQYGAYVDADMIMTRPDWATEAIHQLQKHAWVQLFTTYADLLPDHTTGPPKPSFMKVLLGGATPGDYESTGRLWGGPGGGWAFRREAFDQCGRLLDTCILGSADYHMAVALAMVPNLHPEQRIGTPGYLASIDRWATRAAGLKANVGVVPNFALHCWHGSRRKRGYGSRRRVLGDHLYEPAGDVSYDWQGVLRYNGNKPELERDVMAYFASRDEDSTEA